MILIAQAGYPTSGIKTLKGVSDAIKIQYFSGPVGTMAVAGFRNKILDVYS